MTDYGSIDGKTCEWLHRKWMRSQSDNTDFCDYDDTGGIMRGSVNQTFHHVDPKSEARWLIDWHAGHWRLHRITGFGEDWKREQIASVALRHRAVSVIGHVQLAPATSSNGSRAGC